MTNLIIVILAAVLLIGLLIFEKKGKTGGVLQTKTPLSLLFVLTALVQPHPNPEYFQFIIIGLILCLAGDVFLALPGEKTFLLGLICFLFGHVAYVLGFVSVTGLDPFRALESLIVLGLSLWVYLRLRPYLGPMKGPVVLYVFVITVMLSAALGLLSTPGLNLTGVIMAAVGAACFYLSDVFVARDRFLRKRFANRLLGLPLYYVGQFLLAFSVGWIK